MESDCCTTESSLFGSASSLLNRYHEYHWLKEGLRVDAQETDTYFVNAVAEAEQRLIREPPEVPYLYSARGFEYTSFLLRAAQPSTLSGLDERVQTTLEIAVQNDWLLDMA